MKRISTFALGLMLASAAFAQKGNNAQIPTFQETMGKYFLKTFVLTPQRP